MVCNDLLDWNQNPIMGKINGESLPACDDASRHDHSETATAESPTQKFHGADWCRRWRQVRLSYAQSVAFRYPSAADQKLIQIVDSALAEAARKSGDLLVCRKGCTQCCVGVFAIHQLDAARLQRGLAALEATDPARAAEVHGRARDAWGRLAPDFPGDPATGILDESDEGQKSFEAFANDEPCPALNPADGTCDLYESRPMTCRVFGPPIRSEDGLGACELCYQGVPDEEVAAYEMIPDPHDLESRLLERFERNTKRHRNTIIAFCLASSWEPV